jgi:hypothetical protein
MSINPAIEKKVKAQDEVRRAVKALLRNEINGKIFAVQQVRKMTLQNDGDVRVWLNGMEAGLWSMMRELE